MAAGSFLKLARAQGKIDRLDSEIEATLAQQLKAAKAPAWVRNHRPLLPASKIEIDFAWPELVFGVHVEGEVHRIGERFHGDIRKHWLLLEAGWTSLRVDGRAIRSGEAFVWILKMLRRRAGELARDCA